MNPLKRRAIEKLDQAKSQGLARTHHHRFGLNQSAQFNSIDSDIDSHYVNLSSNDYLGLSQHPDVIKAAQTTSEKYGIGSGASHLITGHCNIHSELEHALASWLEREDCVLFSTGYMANLAVLSSLLTRHDMCLQDKLNHASLIDAGILCRAKITRYTHGSAESILKNIGSLERSYALLATDGVFSMEGDIAPLDDISRICTQNNTLLMVDDAHGLGVLGKNGKGSCEHFDLAPNDAPILMGTLGKAFGTFGAFVSGDSWLCEHLRQFARPYIYTTAMPPSIAAATLKSLEIIQQETWRREKLHHLITQFKINITPICDQFNLTLLPSETAIQSIIIGDAKRTLAISEALKSHSFWVSAIRPPTIPLNTSRLRIALSSLIDDDDIIKFANALAITLKDM